MIGFLPPLFSRALPAISTAGVSDAARFAALHGECFRHGWAEVEFERLLLDGHVVAHRAERRNKLAGLILSRIVGGEAEILSIAVARLQRGRGLAGRLLDIHLRMLASLGTDTVFLEVDEDNAPARRLYARRQFHQVGERKGYYPRAHGGSSSALMLRRDLT